MVLVPDERSWQRGGLHRNSFPHAQGDLDLVVYNAAGRRVGLSNGVTNSELVSLDGWVLAPTTLTFTNELMTGYVGPGRDLPLSRVTIASLADLGYQVNMGAGRSVPPGLDLVPEHRELGSMFFVDEPWTSHGALLPERNKTQVPGPKRPRRAVSCQRRRWSLMCGLTCGIACRDVFQNSLPSPPFLRLPALDDRVDCRLCCREHFTNGNSQSDIDLARTSVALPLAAISTGRKENTYESVHRHEAA